MWHDEPVRWRWAQTTILTALTLLVLGAAFWLGTAATKSDDSPRATVPAHPPADPATLFATVEATPAGHTWRSRTPGASSSASTS